MLGTIVLAVRGTLAVVGVLLTFGGLFAGFQGYPVPLMIGLGLLVTGFGPTLLGLVPEAAKALKNIKHWPALTTEQIENRGYWTLGAAFAVLMLNMGLTNPKCYNLTGESECAPQAPWAAILDTALTVTWMALALAGLLTLVRAFLRSRPQAHA